MNNRSKILIIDDDPAARRILSKYLEKDGYEVFVAENGIDGMEKALTAHPHLIICDWMMPSMDGLQLCKYLKNHPQFKDIYFIFLTALDKTHLSQGIDTGADDFVTKPIDYDEIAAKVRAGLRIVNHQNALLNLTIRDYLTGAFNRNYFDRSLSLAMEYAHVADIPFVLALLDLDNFKFINDQFGHLVGDKVLQEVARLIDQRLTGAAILARIGGDEFACLLYYSTEAEAMAFLGDTAAAVQEFFAHRYPDWPVDFSYGCALFNPRKPVPVHEMYESADRQMYSQKNQKKLAVNAAP